MHEQRGHEDAHHGVGDALQAAGDSAPTPPFINLFRNKEAMFLHGYCLKLVVFILLADVLRALPDN